MYRYQLYCYQCSPIDIWFGAMDRDLVLQSIEHYSEVIEGSNAAAEASVTDLLEAAEDGFRKIGWEGDVREGPFFFALPNPESCEMALGVMLKQDNNGSTFIAIPMRLSWLERDNCGKTIVGGEF